ncbi:MAG: hypothetical protein LBU73_07100 [Helicobacteraceae bacterium]|jgi:hypothetical protein|nr:hypothetical protein [Helicobacteraceae bacterium]
MKIASLVEIAHGTLLNKPTIERVTGFSFSAKNTRRGECYIHLFGHLGEINLAIANGAFAVIFKGDPGDMESESALIFSDDMGKSMSGIARYLLLSKNVVITIASEIEIAIAKALINDKKCLINPPLDIAVEALASENDFCYLCDEKSDLFFASFLQDQIKIGEVKVTKETLFETVIAHNGESYLVQISPLFKRQFANVLCYAATNALKINFSRQIELNRFNKIDVNDRAIIFDEANEEEENEAINFIKRIAPWAKLYIAPKNIKITYSDIRKNRFDIAYINGVKRENFDLSAPSQTLF